MFITKLCKLKMRTLLTNTQKEMFRKEVDHLYFFYIKLSFETNQLPKISLENYNRTKLS